MDTGGGTISGHRRLAVSVRPTAYRIKAMLFLAGATGSSPWSTMIGDQAAMVGNAMQSTVNMDRSITSISFPVGCHMGVTPRGT